MGTQENSQLEMTSEVENTEYTCKIMSKEFMPLIIVDLEVMFKKELETSIDYSEQYDEDVPTLYLSFDEDSYIENYDAIKAYLTNLVGENFKMETI